MKNNSKADLIPIGFFITPVYMRHEKTSSTSHPILLGGLRTSLLLKSLNI